MAKYAEHVYTDQQSIQRLEQLIADLPANARVVLVEADGSRSEGVVSARPNVQVFRDREEREGVNAVVSLQRPEQPDGSAQVWLDQVVDIEHLDSTLASES